MSKIYELDAMAIEITYPLATPSLNQWQRAHYHEQNNIKAQMTLVLRGAASLREPHEIGPARVKIARYSAGTLDWDNLVGGCKPLLDALKSARLIVDDSPKWVAVTYAQFTALPKHGRTEIRIEYVQTLLDPSASTEQDGDGRSRGSARGNEGGYQGNRERDPPPSHETGRVGEAADQAGNQGTGAPRSGRKGVR